MALAAYITINAGQKVVFQQILLGLLERYAPFLPSNDTVLASLGGFDWEHWKLVAPITEIVKGRIQDTAIGSGLAFNYKNMPISIFNTENNTVVIDLMAPRMLNKNLVDFGWYSDFVETVLKVLGGHFQSIVMDQHR